MVLKGSTWFARDGVGDALRGHEAAGGGAGGVEPEEGEDCDGGLRPDDLDEVLAPVVGVSSGENGGKFCRQKRTMMRVGTERSQAEKVEIHMPFATTEEA